MTAKELAMYMRLGAMLRPQAFYRAFSNGGSCAMGAVQEAMGGFTHILNYYCFEQSPWFPLYVEMVKRHVACPECGRVQSETWQFLVPHLNDDHKWSREAIADWLESLKALEPPILAPVPVAGEEYVSIRS